MVRTAEDRWASGCMLHNLVLQSWQVSNWLLLFIPRCQRNRQSFKAIWDRLHWEARRLSWSTCLSAWLRLIGDVNNLLRIRLPVAATHLLLVPNLALWSACAAFLAGMFNCIWGLVNYAKFERCLPNRVEHRIWNTKPLLFINRRPNSSLIVLTAHKKLFSPVEVVCAFASIQNPWLCFSPTFIHFLLLIDFVNFVDLLVDDIADWL